MGKVEYIKSCRKEQKCQKCGTVIPVGNPYYKGVLFRMRPIVRCTSCGLKGYEVTTSEYVQNIGRIVEDWQEDFSVEDGVWEEIASNLEDIKSDCEERLENIPEQLRDADAGSLLQERIDELDGAIDELNYGSWGDFIKEAYDNLGEEQQAVIDAEAEKRGNEDYEEWFVEFCEANSEVGEDWRNEVVDLVATFVEDILSNLSY